MKDRILWLVLCVVFAGLVFVLVWDKGRNLRHWSVRGAEARVKPFVANIRQPVYHKSDDPRIGRLADYNLRGYETEADCRADGLLPCDHCFGELATQEAEE